MYALIRSISKKTTLLVAALATIPGLCVCGTAMAATTLDLSTYTLAGTYSLQRGEDYCREASAVTYNWDTGTLFVVGDEGKALVEVSLTGVTISTMTLEDFEDTEGLTYVGNGQFAIAEERLQDIFLLTYQAGATIDRDDLASVSLGGYVENTGIEGVSYDMVTGNYYTVKEKEDQEIRINTIDFDTETVTSSPASFSADSLGLDDLADIQVLSLIGMEETLLILSQASKQLLEVTLDGTILSSYDLSDLSSSIEGVTVDENRNIYLVAENGSAPSLYVLSPTAVPVPGSFCLLAFALTALAGWRRTEKQS